MTTQLTRIYLLESLEKIIGAEFDPSELVYLTDDELIKMIINAALFYRR